MSIHRQHFLFLSTCSNVFYRLCNKKMDYNYSIQFTFSIQFDYECVWALIMTIIFIMLIMNYYSSSSSSVENLHI